MTQPLPSSTPVVSRTGVIGEWGLIMGLMVTLTWTTLCLGGYLPQTMVVTSVAIFGLVVLGCVLWSRGIGGFNPVALLPVPFLLYALASVWWIAPARWLAWREWLLWVQMWLVFVLVLNFGRGRKLTGIVTATLAGLGLAGVAMAAYQRFADPAWMMLGRSQADQFVGRSAGMFGVPNSLAGLLELIIPVCLTIVCCRPVRPAVKIVSGWLGILFIFALGLSVSRGGWIALSLALLTWPLLSGQRWQRRIAGTGVVLLAVGLGLAALFQFSAQARARLQPFLDGRFEASRPIVWKAGYRIWRDHPVFGAGAASYNVLFDRYRPRGFLNEPQWAHNDYINTLGDYGAVGFLLWAGAGVGLLRAGWRAVRRAQESAGLDRDFFCSVPWRLGLLLGLLAFAFHLAVDFHTKIPALAFLSAVIAGLLLRAEPSQPQPAAAFRWPVLAAAAPVLALAVFLALPLYRAEASRYDSRRSIDHLATNGRTDASMGLREALVNFDRAVELDAGNGQAWADLSYALTLSWQGNRVELPALGKKAETAAARAISLCPVNAEFWIRQGVALDMQARQTDGEPSFRRALELAPNSPVEWYYYAYHLQRLPGRKAEARAAVETCLTLDPSNSAAVLLRQQLAERR